MGVDTAKLSYRVGEARGEMRIPLFQRDGAQAWSRCPWKSTNKFGTQGNVWWSEYKHEDGTVIRAKGVGEDCYLLWEGSVPKYLGIDGVADPSMVRIVDWHVRGLLGDRLPPPAVRRLDVTHDELDPEGALIEAAKGWNPHSRSRYRQAVYLNRSNGGVTVSQMNKSRMIRVYDAFAEHQKEWARDMTRLEYQMRGDWCERMGVDRLYADFEKLAEVALAPLVDDLRSRAGM